MVIAPSNGSSSGFHAAARLGALLAKDYAATMFALLVNYRDISASEAASRANLHIQTAQDFLEALFDLGYLRRAEASEGKRPYYRYSLKSQRIVLEIDLTGWTRSQTPQELHRRIRERPGAAANFALARSGEAISYVSKWMGEGRERRERRINLTTAQGRFLYHLPFPSAQSAPIAEIMVRANVDDSLAPEILDIVDALAAIDVVEKEPTISTDDQPSA